MCCVVVAVCGTMTTEHHGHTRAGDPFYGMHNCSVGCGPGSRFQKRNGVVNEACLCVETVTSTIRLPTIEFASFDPTLFVSSMAAALQRDESTVSIVRSFEGGCGHL